MTRNERPEPEPRAPEEVLRTDMTVEGLRNLCRRTGVTREHGDNKAETIRKIMDQAPGEARSWLEAQGYELTGGDGGRGGGDDREEITAD